MYGSAALLGEVPPGSNSYKNYCRFKNVQLMHMEKRVMVIHLVLPSYWRATEI